MFALLALELLAALLLGACVRCASLERPLLRVVLPVCSCRGAQFEQGDLASTASTQTYRHDGRPDAGSYINGTLGLAALPAAVQSVHILVPDDAPEEELVHARERDLPGMGMPGENQRHAVLPQG